MTGGEKGIRHTKEEEEVSIISHVFKTTLGIHVDEE